MNNILYKKLNEIFVQQEACKEDFVFYYRADYANNKEDKPKEFPIPSIVDIDGYRTKEHEIINEVLVAHPDLFQGLNMFDKLALMRHYECPSRLIDVTASPLVALYFACGEKSEKDKEKKKDRKIFIFAINEKDIKKSDSDTVSILSNIAVTPREQMNKDKEKIENKRTGSGIGDLESISHDCMDYLCREIQQEKPSFKNKINYQDLDNRIVCVRPSYYVKNPRLLAQQGAFLLHGIREADKSQIAKLYTGKLDNPIKMGFIDISGEDLDTLRNELEKLGITRRTLFPEMPDTIAYIKNKYSRKTESDIPDL